MREREVRERERWSEREADWAYLDSHNPADPANGDLEPGVPKAVCVHKSLAAEKERGLVDPFIGTIWSV